LLANAHMPCPVDMRKHVFLEQSIMEDFVRVYPVTLYRCGFSQHDGREHAFDSFSSLNLAAPSKRTLPFGYGSVLCRRICQAFCDGSVLQSSLGLDINSRPKYHLNRSFSQLSSFLPSNQHLHITIGEGLSTLQCIIFDPFVNPSSFSNIPSTAVPTLQTTSVVFVSSLFSVSQCA
jgi:hypothetical protein